MQQSNRDIRLYQNFNWVTLPSLTKAKKNTDTLIISYPDDEGIRLNGGRAGAAKGPDRLLYYLGKLVDRASDSPRLLILRERPQALHLKERHEWAFKVASQVLSLGYRLITLGGGHDYGFSDGAAYFDQIKGSILNIDAHLDVRPVEDEKFHSGTPFFRLIEKYGGKKLAAWGIQPASTALEHQSYARKSGMKFRLWNQSAPPLSGKVGLSLCLDAFENIRGVSAPAMVGLHPTQGLEWISKNAKKMKWLGIYECAPDLDSPTEDSARFGALCLYTFLHPNLGKSK